MAERASNHSAATPAIDIPTILEPLKKIQEVAKMGQVGVREQLLSAVYALAASLETPSEFISRVGWTEPARFACIRIAMNLNLFEVLKEVSSPMTAAQLSEATGAVRPLLARLMKHLAATHVVNESGTDAYTSSDLSNALTEPKYRNGIIYCYDVAGETFRQLPSYMAEKSYINPTNPIDGPFQYVYKTPLHFFSWLQENPKYLEAFGSYMTGYRQGKASWMDKFFFPAEQKLSLSSSDSVVIVDVGGGAGHDLLELRSKLPNLKGRMILQDRPEVIGRAPTDQLSPASIEAMAHDFFTEQPIKGAKAYYLHSILHDWDDDSCIKILKQLRNAMSKESLLLVNEYVVPDKGAAWSITSMDWLMMALGSVRERSESEFKHLLTQAGFELKKIWSIDQGTESLIEAVTA